MNDTLVIAVDGPSGSGKSSTARGVAQRLGLRYLDTGAMYRAVTWWMLGRGIDVTDSATVAAHVVAVRLDSGTDPRGPTITVSGTDVAGPIRSPEVTAVVSAVSAVPEVRAHLVTEQRRIIGDGGIVVEGRDIGSTVAPAAHLKVYLVADQEARAARRTSQVGGDPASIRATAADLARRDALDSTRAASPLSKADDAIVVDSTYLTLDEVVAHIVDLAHAIVGPST